ncbi:MAG: hypothetical protein ABI467_20850 [Kofleriaceae bacterium]
MSKIRIALISALVALPIGVYAGGVMKGHRNLEAARSALDTADARISAAQRANEFDLDGHAAKAKDAIATAKEELRLAAETSNEHKR